MRGSEPGSSRSSSRKVLRGRYSGPSGPQRDGPRLLPLFEAQGVAVRVQLLDAGLGVVGRQLAAHHPVAQAAGHEGHAVHVPGQLQGEGLRHRNGLEQVLDAQQGALPRPGRRHRQQHGAFVFAIGSEKEFLRVQLHGV